MSAPLNARDMAIDFDGWAEKLPDAQRAGIMEHLSGLQDAAAEKRKLANIFWIAERQRLPLRTVSDNYNALLAAHATREGWGDAFAKDDAFHARVVSEAATELNEEVMVFGDRSKGETEQNRESIRKSLMWKAYEAGQNPKGSRFQAMSESFAKWNTAASKSPSYRPQNAGKYWNQWVQQFERGYQVFEPARQAAERVFPRLRFGDDYNPTDAEPFIADLTDEQFSVMLREMRIKADKKGGQGEQPMDMIEGIGQSAGRAVARNVAGAVDFLGKRALDYKFREGEPVRADWLAKGVPFMAETVAATAGTEGLTEGYTPPDDAPRVALTAEQAKEANAFLERKQRVIRRLSTLRDFREGTINPIGDDDSIIDAAVYGAAQSLGQMATVAVPYLGTATAWASYANDAENRYIANGYTAEDARKLAPWTGAVQAAADKMQLGLFKKIPALDQVFVRFGARLPVALTARTATITAGETLIELGQDEIAPELIADIGKAVGATMKGGDWEDMAARLEKSGVEMFPSMLLLGLVGGGAASWRDVQNFKALTSDPELLKAYGFTAEHAASIALAADSREAATLVRQFWGEREKTSSPVPAESQRSVASGADVGGMGGESLLPSPSPGEATADSGEVGSSPVVEPGLRPGWTFTDFAEYDRQQNLEAGVVALRRDDDGWRVVLEDGGSVQVGTVDAAMHLRDTLKRAKTEREADALVAIADEISAGFAKEGRKSEQVFSGDLYQVVDGKVSKTDRSGKTSDVKFFGNTAAELNREVEMVGGTRQFIQGANWIAEDGTRMMQTNLAGDRVFTMIHEMAETRLRAIMRDDAGASAVAAARVLAKTNLFDPAKQRNREDKELAQRVQNIAAGKTNETEARETIVELVVANWLSRRKDGSNFAAGSVSAAIDEAARSLASAADVKAFNWFRSMLRAVKAYLRGIFGMAAKLAKARREGTLKDGDDFSALADKLMGLDPQRKHNEAVVKEVDVKSEATDQAFSIRQMPVELTEARNRETVQTTALMDQAEAQERLKQERATLVLLKKLEDCLKK